MMTISRFLVLFGLIACAFAASPVMASDAAQADAEATPFPRPLDGYGDSGIASVMDKLQHRAQIEPFNLVATLIFFLAIIHTFMSSKLLAIAHKWDHENTERIARNEIPANSVHMGSRAFHFLGEIETVFGVWAIALLGAIVMFYDWGTASHYVADGVNFTEAFFIVVIMTLASSRPILKFAEAFMDRIARGLGGSITVWWFTILTLGPLLGSFITEPASITISALLLAKKFYRLDPSPKMKYMTIGLLFVNTSIGGTLTHFAAPPVLMVAGPWGWDMVHMLTNFGWKAILGILLVNTVYYYLCRKEFTALGEKFRTASLEEGILSTYLDRGKMESAWDDAISEVDEELEGRSLVTAKVEEVSTAMKDRLRPSFVERIIAQGIDSETAERLFEDRFNEVKLFRLRRETPLLLTSSERGRFQDPEWNRREDPVPIWIIAVHIVFMVWTILNAHYPALFVPGLLFYLAFAQVTSQYQNTLDLRSPMLVGFFLGGLLIHGGVQAWWIEPVLGSLAEVPLMLAATIMTAFNDNAAITFLATLIPGITDPMKYAVVAGAVAGGGLTVIANAPNPAGQSILKEFFDNGVSPAKLFLAALGPTVVIFLIFLLI